MYTSSCLVAICFLLFRLTYSITSSPIAFSHRLINVTFSLLPFQWLWSRYQNLFWNLARRSRAKLRVAVTNWMDHFLTKFQKYRTKNFGAINVLVTSLHAILDPKVAIVCESIKGKLLNGNIQNNPPTILPAICEIWKTGVHVRMCRCTPPQTCAKHLSNRPLATHQIWTQSAQPFARSGKLVCTCTRADAPRPDLCKARIYWALCHTQNLNTILPAVCEIWKRGVHVRTCRCTPPQDM